MLSHSHLMLVLLLDAVAARAQIGARRHKVHVVIRVVVLLELGRPQAVAGECSRRGQRGSHLREKVSGGVRDIEKEREEGIGEEGTVEIEQGEAGRSRASGVRQREGRPDEIWKVCKKINDI